MLASFKVNGISDQRRTDCLGISLRADAPQVRFAFDENAAAGDGSAGVVGVVAQIVDSQLFIFGTGLDDVGFA
jgi:hypothetical protein